MNTFEKFKAYLNDMNEYDDFIHRKRITKADIGWMPTVDKYRAWFTAAGYLKWIKRGVYLR